MVVDDVDVLEVEDPELVREVAQEIESAPSQQELVIGKVVESHNTGPAKLNREEVSRRGDRHDRSRSRGLRHEEDQREHRRQWRRGESWESYGSEKRSHDRSDSRSAHDRNQKKRSLKIEPTDDRIVIDTAKTNTRGDETTRPGREILKNKEMLFVDKRHIIL